MDPEQQRLAIMQALSRLGGVPQQPIPQTDPRRMSGASIAPSEWARMQAMQSAPVRSAQPSPSGFDPRRMSGAAMSQAEWERFNAPPVPYERPTGEITPSQLRTDELAPVYDALDERDERDSEPPPPPATPAMMALRSLARR